MRAVTTLTQSPVREVTGYRNRVGNDGIHRDIVQPFQCQRRDYLLCAGFSNSIEQLGIKPSIITALENQNRGFRLSMNSDFGTEYEVEVRGGHAKLGLVRNHQPRLLLAEGSASSEASWQRFSEIIKRQEEGK